MVVHSDHKSSRETDDSRVRIIGDIHGRWREYVVLAEKSEGATIQVGDFGVGFCSDVAHVGMNRWMSRHGDGRQHRFIRGNHDNPATAKTMIGYIPDMTVMNDVMFIGGAWSIDYANRMQGYDWWHDEELSYAELQIAIAIYCAVKPRVMITHDCPLSVSNKMFIDAGQSLFGAHQHKTRTGQALQTMWEASPPERWYFGHWHVTKSMQANGTDFMCLGELAHIDVELNLGNNYGK